MILFNPLLWGRVHIIPNGISPKGNVEDRLEFERDNYSIDKANTPQELLHSKIRGCSRGVMVKALVCGIAVNEFELQSCYYVHFRTNSHGKGMTPPNPPSYGLNSTTAILLEVWLLH